MVAPLNNPSSIDVPINDIITKECTLESMEWMSVCPYNHKRIIIDISNSTSKDIYRFRQYMKRYNTKYNEINTFYETSQLVYESMIGEV